MTTHRGHTLRPIHQAMELIGDLFKVALGIYGAGALSMLIFVLYFHI
jgi:hypothetical protein